MSANINGVGKFGWKDREDICVELLGYSRNVVHIIGFQESPWNMGRIEGALGKKWNLIHGERDEDLSANSIAYNRLLFECQESNIFWQSEDGSHKKDWDGIRARATSWARFRHRSSRREFLLLNSHLDNMGVEARKRGTLLNLDVVKAFPDLPAIFVADMNVSVHSPFLRHKDPQHPAWDDPQMTEPYDLMIEAGFKDCMIEPFRNQRNQDPKRERTFNGYRNTYQYNEMEGDDYGLWDPDYILVRDLQIRNCSVRSSYHPGGAYGSDHDWPVAELDFL